MEVNAPPITMVVPTCAIENTAPPTAFGVSADGTAETTLSCCAFTAQAGDPASRVPTTATRTAATRRLVTIPPRERRWGPCRPPACIRRVAPCHDAHLRRAWSVVSISYYIPFRHPDQ